MGNFENDKKEGGGKLVYPNGDNFSGTWKDNVPQGKGIYEIAHKSNTIKLRTFGY